MLDELQLFGFCRFNREASGAPTNSNQDQNRALNLQRPRVQKCMWKVGIPFVLLEQGFDRQDRGKVNAIWNAANRTR